MPSNHVGSPRKVLSLMILAIALCGGAARALPATPVSCPLAGFANASSFNGFYVTGYSGNNLSLVTLAYAASFAEKYGITLTAHRNTYDGPIVGTAQTAVVNLPMSGETAVTFDFHGAAVTPGDRIAFTQDIEVLGSTGASVFYDGGSGACPGVVQTVGEFPPLGGATAGTAGVTITENVPATGGPFPPLCVSSDTTLCIDDSPGDRRFEVKASYNTSLAGGLSGDASAIPTKPLGVNRGGLFWFFSPDNPEVLVKVLNGCALNDHYWVYVTAGTNAGFTVTVKDTALARSKTYTNPDLTAALPVQDTLALASCQGCASDADCRTGLLCCHLPAGPMGCLVPQAGSCPALP